MIAYKLIEQTNGIEKGRIFCEANTQMLIIATPTKPQSFISKYKVNKLHEKQLVETIDLMDETKLHPHLFKPLKEAVYKLK